VFKIRKNSRILRNF